MVKYLYDERIHPNSRNGRLVTINAEQFAQD